MGHLSYLQLHLQRNYDKKFNEQELGTNLQMAQLYYLLLLQKLKTEKMTLYHVEKYPRQYIRQDTLSAPTIYESK